jgi:hypothetical protein
VLFKKFGISVKWVKTDDPEEFRKAIDDKSKGIYLESIGNPKYNVPNLAEIAKVSPLRICLPLYRLTGPPSRSLTRLIFPSSLTTLSASAVSWSVGIE